MAAARAGSGENARGKPPGRLAAGVRRAGGPGPRLLLAVIAAFGRAPADADEKSDHLRLGWRQDTLSIRADWLPGGTLDVWYLEAYCRGGSAERAWEQTVVGHQTELVSVDDDERRLELRCRVADGLVVEHLITAGRDEVEFRLEARNPTAADAEAQWAQPCIRVDRFTGRTQDDYLPLCFLFVEGRLERLPLATWARRARYTPGQVWCPREVDRRDVNPRPLSPVVPSHGLIGCFSGDERMIMATAWEPYQELFQGVIVCLHADIRLGRIQAGGRRLLRGKIYLVPADVEALWSRYRRDFPEHFAAPSPNHPRGTESRR